MANKTIVKTFCDRCEKELKKPEDIKKETFNGKEYELCEKCVKQVEKAFTKRGSKPAEEATNEAAEQTQE